MSKELETAAVAAGGGLLAWFTRKLTSRWKDRFDKMEKMADFFQSNAERLMTEIQRYHNEYDQLNKSYLLVIEQNRTLIIEDNNNKIEIGKLRLEIKKLKGEIV